MKLEESFGLFELRQYADSSWYKDLLITERDEVVQAMYDDISPTMVSYDEAGQLYTVSYNPETTALHIIDTKEKYQKMIDKESRKALLFEAGMATLTDRERDVVKVHYLNHKSNLGLSPEFFLEVLTEAQEKLCSFLGNAKVEQIQAYQDEFKKVRLRVKC